MKKEIKEQYKEELEEMSNNELLFEFDFCCSKIERLIKLHNNDSFYQTRLSGEIIRKGICKEEILSRMGGKK
jgi:hypothetical protein